MPKLELLKNIPETINCAQLQMQMLWSQFQITPETTKVITQVLSNKKTREKLARLRESLTQQTMEAAILAISSRIMIQRLF